MTAANRELAPSNLDELVTKAATTLMGVPSTGVTPAAERVLQSLVEYFAVDVSFLRFHDPERRATLLIAQWPPRAEVPDPDPLGTVYFESADPLMAATEHMTDVWLIRPSDSEEYQERVRRGAGVDSTSVAIVPLRTGDNTTGTLGFVKFGDRGWVDDEIRALKTIATLIAQMQGRLLAEDQLRHIAQRALRLSAELQESRQRLVLMRADERRRIQRDLHDGIGPSLAGLRMQLGAAQAMLREGRTEATARTLQEIEMQVVECANDIRELLVSLRSPLLDSFGLVGALRYQAEKMAVKGQLSVTVSTDTELPDLPAAIEAAALTIVSEAMANVVRHSGATQCTVHLVADPHLSVAVTDNGCGITPTARDGIGLRSMRERAEGVGGTCAVGTGSCGGTEVRVVFPPTAL